MPPKRKAETVAGNDAKESKSGGGPDSLGRGAATSTTTENEKVLTKKDDGGSHHYMAMNNRAPIARHFQRFLKPNSAEAKGLALEIGSGTGAQLEVLAVTYPNLMFRPSEFSIGQVAVRGFYEQGPDGPDPGYPVKKARTLAALDAAMSKCSNVLPAVELDGSTPFESWPAAVTESGRGSYAVVFASNVVHISPWAVAEGIFAGAAAALRRGGSLVFHGPFKQNGKCVNADTTVFDTQMRAWKGGKGWGVREVSVMAAEAAKQGFRHAATEHPVGPAKNYLLQFVKE